MHAVPRLASTLVLLSSAHHHPGRWDPASPGNDIRVLMVKRHSKARFLPNTYVFPGGGVEESDYTTAARFLQDSGANGANAPEDVHTYWATRVAAVRELSEETACVLGYDGRLLSTTQLNTVLSKMPTYTSTPPWRPGSYCASAAARLSLLGRWITPTTFKHRYDTYFYAVAVQPRGRRSTSSGTNRRGIDSVPDAVNILPQAEELQPQLSEIDGIVWASPLEALRQHEDPDLPFLLSPPTYLLLHSLSKQPSYAALAHALAFERHSACDTALSGVVPRVAGTFPDISRYHIPEEYFRSMGPDFCLPRGRYRFPNPHTDGEATNFVDMVVGSASDEAPVVAIHH